MEIDRNKQKRVCMYVCLCVFVCVCVCVSMGMCKRLETKVIISSGVTTSSFSYSMPLRPHMVSAGGTTLPARISVTIATVVDVASATTEAARIAPIAIVFKATAVLASVFIRLVVVTGRWKCCRPTCAKHDRSSVRFSTADQEFTKHRLQKKEQRGNAKGRTAQRGKQHKGAATQR